MTQRRNLEEVIKSAIPNASPLDGLDVEAICARVRRWLLDENPNLGLATTRHLLQELQARAEFEVIVVDRQWIGLLESIIQFTKFQLERLPEEVLNYKTVDRLKDDLGGGDDAQTGEHA